MKGLRMLGFVVAIIATTTALASYSPQASAWNLGWNFPQPWGFKWQFDDIWDFIQDSHHPWGFKFPAQQPWGFKFPYPQPWQFAGSTPNPWAPGIGEQESIHGSGHVVEESQMLSGVVGVTVIGNPKVFIELGDAEELSIEGEDNIIDSIETEVEAGTLVIRPRVGVDLRPTVPVNIYLTVKTLEHLNVAGSASIDVSDLVTDQFTVRVGGSAVLQLGGLDTNRFDASISGSANVSIASGDVLVQDITLAGSGEYNAADVASTETAVDIVGSASATVRASDYLVAYINGSGRIRYYDDPIVQQTVEGTGRIEPVAADANNPNPPQAVPVGFMQGWFQ